jgi:hypothetical protein
LNTITSSSITSNPLIDESPASLPGFGRGSHRPSAWSCASALAHCWALPAATTSLHSGWSGPLSIAQHAASASHPLLPASFESAVASMVMGAESAESAEPAESGPESLDSFCCVTPPPHAPAAAAAITAKVTRANVALLCMSDL